MSPPQSCCKNLDVHLTPAYISYSDYIKCFKVKRQDEPLLIQAIKELCDGNHSQQTHAFLRSLDRPIAAQEEPTMLFGTNFDVDFWNQEKVDAMPGEARHYRSQDTGELNPSFLRFS